MATFIVTVLWRALEETWNMTGVGGATNGAELPKNQIFHADGSDVRCLSFVIRTAHRLRLDTPARYVIDPDRHARQLNM